MSLIVPRLGIEHCGEICDGAIEFAELAVSEAAIQVGVDKIRLQIDALLVIFDGVAVLAEARVQIAARPDRGRIVEPEADATAILGNGLFSLTEVGVNRGARG